MSEVPALERDPRARPHEESIRPGSPRLPNTTRALLLRLLFEGAGWIVLRLVVDASLLVLAVYSALVGAPEALGPDGRTLVWFFVPAVIGLFFVRRLYRVRRQGRAIDDLPTLVAATSLAAVILIAAAAFIDPGERPAGLIARAWLFATITLGAAQVILAESQRRARATGSVGCPTLIVGAGLIGARVERRLTEQPELGLEPIGYLDADPPNSAVVPLRRAAVLGTPDDIEEVAASTGARHVVLAFSSSPDSVLLPLVRHCERLGLEVSLVPRMFESINVRVALEHLGGLPLYGLRWVNPKGWQFAFKHVLDRLLAVVMIVLLSPLLLAIALAVAVTSRGPILFRQRRIGRDGREFDMLKFRSMRASSAGHDPVAQAQGGPEDVGPGGVEGDDRRTRVGKVIRRTSLDELPQLFNVVMGEMSIVGPRPERPDLADLFGRRMSRYHDRHRVKSGITGWAQVHGLRGKTSLADRIEWDNWYIENWSVALDLKILLMTVTAVFHRAE